MSSPSFFFLVIILCASASLRENSRAAAPQPDATSPCNIILILADDLGMTALGSYGSTFYETPHLDHLASQGVRFTNAFAAAANCAPSRASIMSGQYTPRHGVLYVGPGDYQEKYKERAGNLARFPMIQPPGQTELPDTITFLSQALQHAGYRTASFGKWHLGRQDQAPEHRGFDLAIESHGAHYNFKTEPETDHPKDEYLSDFLSHQAVQFIEDSARKEQPFFLYYPDFLVHAPLETKPEYLEHFSNKEPSATQKSPVAAAMIKALDDSVGKVLATLDQLDLADNTLVIFTSDNGGLSYEEDGFREENTSNRPLRGRKGSQYDGGLRIPFIARWPGHIPPGTTSSTPVHHIDLFPTFLALARADPPPQTLDGINLLPPLRDPASPGDPRLLYWFLPGYSAFNDPSVMVRKGNFKLIRALDSNHRKLYDTAADIGEATDLTDTHPELAADLDRAAAQWLDDTNAPRMTPNPEYDPAARK